jgi:hypothetical protein
MIATSAALEICRCHRFLSSLNVSIEQVFLYGNARDQATRRLTTWDESTAGCSGLKPRSVIFSNKVPQNDRAERD